MNEVAFYEFMLKLNTFLNRLKFLSGKMLEQENHLRDTVMKDQELISPSAFNTLFQPMIDIIEARIISITELAESGTEMSKQIQEFYDAFKGIVQ